MPASVYLARPTNKSCHNYLTNEAMPRGLRSLLGHGLNYCIKRSRPTNNITKTFNRFRDDIRRTWFFRDQPNDDQAYNHKLYIKSGTKFDPADPEVEECINKFEAAFRAVSRRYRRPKRMNISARHYRLLASLKEHDTFIVTPADKNLGPCILERELYIKRAIQEHLGNERNYQVLTTAEANSLHWLLRREFSIFISKAKIPDEDKTFLRRALRDFPDKKARFYQTLKAHKSPWKMRPIVACCGTFMNAWSQWLDYYLQQLKPFVATYVKDTKQILDEVRQIDDLPPNAFLFTADADAMYNNIDTEHAIEVIEAWLDELSTHPDFPIDFPLQAVKDAMKMIMRNNLFEFGDLFILQLLGTAMGTSAAVMWATLYYGYHETKKLLPTYQLCLYRGRLRRFIDDMLGIWICNECGHWKNCHHWRSFKNDLKFGVLTWTVNEPGKHCVFLDLNIRIEGQRITTSTYQKPMNLYLYLPSSSAHSDGMIKGVIHGRLRAYKEQNTYYADYLKFARLLYKRLIARGWSPSYLKPIFLKAHAKLKAIATQPTSEPSTPPTVNTSAKLRKLFLHLQYHPEDVPRRVIRGLYDTYCAKFGELLGVEPITIAYSRAENIGDLATGARLYQAPGLPASHYMGEFKQGLDP